MQGLITSDTKIYIHVLGCSKNKLNCRNLLLFNCFFCVSSYEIPDITTTLLSRVPATDCILLFMLLDVSREGSWRFLWCEKRIWQNHSWPPDECKWCMKHAKRLKSQGLEAAVCVLSLCCFSLSIFLLFFCPLQAAIRKELNDFKSNEMEVHESSRHLTR